MDGVISYSARNTRTRSSVGSGSGGGDVEDILKRLGNVETGVSELRSEVSAVLAIIPHLATKADVADVRAAVVEARADVLEQVGQVRADLPAQVGQVRTDLTAQIGHLRADLAAQIGELRADLSAGLGQAQANLAAAETAIIKWIIATVLASAALAFTIAKFVH
jgi:hypothetical protein